MLRSALAVFSGLYEIARTSLDGQDYVLYRDGQGAEWVHASDFDQVPDRYQDDADGYSLWCAEAAPAVGEAGLYARLLAAAGLEEAHHSNAVGRMVEPA